VRKTYIVKGERLTVQQVAIKYDLPVSTVRSRFERNTDVDPSDLVYKMKPGYKRNKLFTYQKQEKTLEGWHKVYPHLSVQMIRRRFKEKIDLLQPAGARKTPNPNWERVMPIYQQDTELKNRIMSYRKKGLSDAEIFYKVTKGDFTHGKKF